MQINNSRAAESSPHHESADISDPVIINALADPTRFAVFSAIAWGSARTIREVGERIGRKPGSLYRHFDVLEGLGLIRRSGTIGTARRDARLYEADAGSKLVYDNRDPEVVEAINNVVASATRNAARSFARSARKGAVTRGADRDTHMATQSGWLNKEELAQFNAMVNEMREFLVSHERRPGTRLIQATLVMSPAAN
jgi:DNA-binding MarR family transcriptional regulator